MPKATVELHADGRFDVCMRLPDGTENWSRCHFTEVMEPEKISIAGSMEGPSGKWFNIVTTIILMEETGGTRLEVVQDYKVFSAKALRSLTGVEAGWNSTLTQLGQEAERLAARSLHGTFSPTSDTRRTRKRRRTGSAAVTATWPRRNVKHGG